MTKTFSELETWIVQKIKDDIIQEGFGTIHPNLLHFCSLYAEFLDDLRKADILAKKEASKNKKAKKIVPIETDEFLEGIMNANGRGKSAE